jgi:hypothetical protein
MYQDTPSVPLGMGPFGDWFSDVFRLWGARWQVWVLQGLLYAVLVFTLPVTFYIVLIATTVGGNPSREAVALVGVLYFVAIVVASISSFVLLPGMVVTALRQMRGEEISVSGLFSGMRYGFGFFLVTFLAGLGVLACFVGAYALQGLLFLALPLMIDRQLRTTEAISLSWRTTMANPWLYILFTFVITLLSGVGAMACYIGLIATIPFLAIGQAVAYHRTFYSHTLFPAQAAANVPPPYIPPPYIPGSPIEPSAPAQDTVANGANRCPRCGANIVDGIKQCPLCGESWGDSRPQAE